MKEFKKFVTQEMGMPEPTLLLINGFRWWDQSSKKELKVYFKENMIKWISGTDSGLFKFDGGSDSVPDSLFMILYLLGNKPL